MCVAVWKSGQEPKQQIYKKMMLGNINGVKFLLHSSCNESMHYNNFNLVVYFTILLKHKLSQIIEEDH